MGGILREMRGVARVSNGTENHVHNVGQSASRHLGGGLPVQDQERHHRRMTFEEEFIALLRKHGIAFDERFL